MLQPERPPLSQAELTRRSLFLLAKYPPEKEGVLRQAGETRLKKRRARWEGALCPSTRALKEYRSPWTANYCREYATEPCGNGALQ